MKDTKNYPWFDEIELAFATHFDEIAEAKAVYELKCGAIFKSLLDRVKSQITRNNRYEMNVLFPEEALSEIYLTGEYRAAVTKKADKEIGRSSGIGFYLDNGVENSPKTYGFGFHTWIAFKISKKHAKVLPFQELSKALRISSIPIDIVDHYYGSEYINIFLHYFPPSEKKNFSIKAFITAVDQLVVAYPIFDKWIAEHHRKRRSKE